MELAVQVILSTFTTQHNMTYWEERFCIGSLISQPVIDPILECFVVSTKHTLGEEERESE